MSARTFTLPGLAAVYLMMVLSSSLLYKEGEVCAGTWRPSELFRSFICVRNFLVLDFFCANVRKVSFVKENCFYTLKCLNVHELYCLQKRKQKTKCRTFLAFSNFVSQSSS